MSERFEQINVEDIGDGIALITFCGDNISNKQQIEKMGEELFSVVEQQGKNKILLNFANIKCFASDALIKLITLNRMVLKARGKLIFYSISKEIFEVFEITKLDKLFNIFRDEQSALQSSLIA